MKLVSFPHYTCGGLLCDMLNNTFSPVARHGGIASIHHSVGKIGDSTSVFTDFDHTLLLEKISELPSDQYIGTHCWPGNLPHDKFDHIINITTTTERSKLYRWVRAYTFLYSPQWTNLSGMDRIDKIKETAKNYIAPFQPVFASNVYNLEFSEVVENTYEFNNLFKDTDKHMNRWQKINHFLYDENFWNRIEVKAYYQATYEIELKKHYTYE